MTIKRLIRKAAESVFQSSWYPNKKILLESNPDMDSQTLPLFDYMLKEGLNREYKLIWLVRDKNEFRHIKIKNVYFQNFYPSNFLEKAYRFYTLCTSRALVYSHKYIDKVFKKQVLFYLRHGSFIKSRLKHCQTSFPNQCDICICMSHFFDEIEERQMFIPRERFVYTGYPTDDYILEGGDYTAKLFPNEQFAKTIIWLPTFRKMKDSDRVDSSFALPLGIPCLYTEEECVAVNRVLKENNILLVLKPHPAQDLSIIKGINLSNFKIISDQDLKKAGVLLYQYLGSTDAMITDYSSVYYDYLLTDHMIGITVDDYEQYERDSGFAVDYFNVVVGEYMKNYKDFMTFVENVAKGIDTSYEKRKAVKDMVFDHTDASNTRRAYETLMNLLKERY